MEHRWNPGETWVEHGGKCYESWWNMGGTQLERGCQRVRSKVETDKEQG